MRKFIKIHSLIFCLGFILSGSSFAQEALTWQDCLFEAQKNHPDLVSAVENVRAQKADKDIVKSDLYPQIDADADASTSKATSTSASTGITSTSTSDSFSVGVSASQLIFDGFKTANQAKAAEENIEAARQTYRFVSSQVRLDLRTAFINLLKAQELSKVQEEIVKIRRDNLVLITMHYESGLEHKGALLTAESNLDQARFELEQTKRNLELAQFQLNKEMGRKEFFELFVRGEFALSGSVQEKPDFKALAKDHPSLKIAQAQKRSAGFSVNSAYSEFAPIVSATASASKKSSDWPPESDNYGVGFSVSVPIFEGGLRKAQVEKAKASYNKLQADERSAQDSLIVSLEQYWIDLEDNFEYTHVQAKALQAAQERSRVAEAQYATGFITFDNWIIIENDLVRAKRAYLDALANALYAEANWVYAKGETLEYAD